MEIYIVQEGDSIDTISNHFGISIDILARNNGLEYPYELAIGQALVIAHPTLIHTVQEGDTLQGIADMYGVSLRKILRNNPYLIERVYIHPEETIIISYDTIVDIATIGFAYPYIRRSTLLKNLLNLTYLSVFNYSVSDRGEINEYYDDREIVQASVEYGVIPLLMLSTLTPYGEPNAEIAYNLLLNEEYQDNLLGQIVSIMRNKGYLGLNMVFNYLNENSQMLYQNLVKKISERIRQEGYLFFITINYDNKKRDNSGQNDQVDYAAFNSYVDIMIFIKLYWGTNYDPPSPVSDIKYLRSLVNYLITQVPVDKLMIGKPLLGYVWPIPFIPNTTRAISMALDAVLQVANNSDAMIQFDGRSQTPYFFYNQEAEGVSRQQVVWFVDARSINALNNLIHEYSLYGAGIWNIMIYHPQLWTILNSQYEIIKLL